MLLIWLKTSRTVWGWRHMTLCYRSGEHQHQGAASGTRHYGARYCLHHLHRTLLWGGWGRPRIQEAGSWGEFYSVFHLVLLVFIAGIYVLGTIGGLPVRLGRPKAGVTDLLLHHALRIVNRGSYPRPLSWFRDRWRSIPGFGFIRYSMLNLDFAWVLNLQLHLKRVV